MNDRFPLNDIPLPDSSKSKSKIEYARMIHSSNTPVQEKQRLHQIKFSPLSEVSSISQISSSEGSKKESAQSQNFNPSREISEILFKILSLIQEEKLNEIDLLLIQYQNLLEVLVTKKQLDQTNVEETKKEKEEHEEHEEEYYASGCVMNFHLRCVKHIKSEEEIQQLIAEADQMIEKYGKKLIPHELYKLHKVHKEVPTQEARNIDASIRQQWTSKENANKFFIAERLTEALAEDGVELLLSNKKPSKERDCFSVLTSGGCYHERSIKVTLERRDERDFENMAKNKEYASIIYKEVRQAIILSGMFQVQRESEIKIVAFECNSPLTAYAYCDSLNGFGGQVNDRYEPPDLRIWVSISSLPIIRYLELHETELTNQVQEWDPKNLDQVEDERGRLPYFLPVGWKGYNLNVRDKYGQDRPDWLQDLCDRNYSGHWAVGYHGVSSNASTKIPSIIRGTFMADKGQNHRSEPDYNNRQRQVGVGIYFANNVTEPETDYSEVIQGQLQNYIVLLQCRLYTPEVRRPQSRPHYYVVPNGQHARPYRVLIKELGKQNELFTTTLINQNYYKGEY